MEKINFGGKTDNKVNNFVMLCQKYLYQEVDASINKLIWLNKKGASDKALR